MKKSFSLILLAFLVVGIFASSYFVLADDSGYGNSPAVSSSNLGNGYAGSPTYSGNGEDVMNQLNVQNHTEANYMSNGRQVHVDREVEVEDGNVTITITKTVTYANGSQVNYTIQINRQNQSGVLVNTMNMESDGENFNVSIGNGLNISDQFFGNQSQIIANLSNGSSVNITVLPDEAMQKVLERLRLRNLTFNNGTNASIQLQEKLHNNIPQVVYNIEGDKPGRFLGIFKIATRVSTEVNPETGQIVSVSQPWWAFLVSSSSTSSSNTGNETNQTFNAANNSS